MDIVQTDILRQKAIGGNTPPAIKEWMDQILLNREYVSHTHAVTYNTAGATLYHYVILLTKDPS